MRKLADGAPFTAATTLGPDGEIGLHAMLHANTASVHGWSAITGVSIDGAADWMKMPQPAASRMRSFKQGIPRHTLQVEGAKFVRPPNGQIFFTASPGPGNFRIRFRSGGLTNELVQALELTAANAVRMPTLAALNPQTVRLTLNPNTGAIGGSFVLKDPDPLDVTPPIATLSRTALFDGLLITRPGIGQGLGHFNLAELPDAAGETVGNTPMWSGEVIFEPTPPPAPD